MRPSHLVTCLLVAAVAGCDAPHVEVVDGPLPLVEEVEGQGAPACAGNVVTIDYVLTLPDGREVLSGQGFRFTLGRGAVITGIDDTVTGMRPGGRRVIECPPHLHWGRAGYGDGAVPPNTPLVIDVRLLGVERLQ